MLLALCTAAVHAPGGRGGGARARARPAGAPDPALAAVRGEWWRRRHDRPAPRAARPSGGHAGNATRRGSFRGRAESHQDRRGCAAAPGTGVALWPAQLARAVVTGGVFRTQVADYEQNQAAMREAREKARQAQLQAQREREEQQRAAEEARLAREAAAAAAEAEQVRLAADEHARAEAERTAQAAAAEAERVEHEAAAAAQERQRLADEELAMQVEAELRVREAGEAAEEQATNALTASTVRPGWRVEVTHSTWH